MVQIMIVVELSHFVAVHVFQMFSRASANIGNAVLIPGFGVKFDFCFFSGVLGSFLLSV